MKQTIKNVYQFRDAFAEAGRKDQFSYEGLQVLWDYLEGYEQDTGEELECDVIGFCCDFCEDTDENIRRDFSIDKDKDVQDALNEFIIGRTSEGSFVYISH